MNDTNQDAPGFVYILDVKDIALPVCKIGMTTRDPYLRCDEINSSSTGDFLWEVAHYIAVSDCKAFESLIHSKLAPLRQKRREFFNLTAEDAYTAVRSILDGQSSITTLDMEADPAPSKRPQSRSRQKPRTSAFRQIDAEYAELLQAFTEVLNTKGRPFGQLNKPSFGISDGVEGVQWNLSVTPDAGLIRVGVNLEGMKYHGWPISRLIASELAAPSIEQIKAKVTEPSEVHVHFARDAWQVTSRLAIVEKYMGGRKYLLSELDNAIWNTLLEEALGCLNKDANYRGRVTQRVTLENIQKNGEQTRLVPVSPHLTIWTPMTLSDNHQQSLQAKIEQLMPVHDWMVEKCK